MEVILVRKSGPVQNMRFKAWWFYFIFLVLLLLLFGLGLGSYLLYTQHKALMELAEETHLMILRTERLESLVQEQETNALLAQQEVEKQAALVRSEEAGQKQIVTTTEVKPEPKPEVKPEPEPTTTVTEPPTTTAPEPEKTEIKAKEEPPKLAVAEPTTSDQVAIENVARKVQNGEMIITFRVANQRSPSEKAVGYVTVVARGERNNMPWIEGWPPMRLSPLGRPLNYRRGTPFSVQYHRPLKATFAMGDKDLKRLEFVVYDQKGDLLLVHNLDLTKDESESAVEENKEGD